MVRPGEEGVLDRDFEPDQGPLLPAHGESHACQTLLDEGFSGGDKVVAVLARELDAAQTEHDILARLGWVGVLFHHGRIE